MRGWFTLTLLCLSLGGPVLAQRPPAGPTKKQVEEARAHYRAGEKAFLAGDYDRAREEFLAANRLASRPALFYNLAQVAVRQGKNDEAISYFKEYLATSPPDASQIEKEIERLSPKPEAPPAPAPAPPPPAVVTAPPPAPVVLVPEPGERRQEAPAFRGPLLLGIGVPCLVTGIALLAAGGAASPDEADDPGKQRARSLLTSGGYLTVAGGLATAAGAALFVIDHRSRARISLIPSGPGLSLGGSF